ncbi:T9SS type B sorting domain-containing protein [Olleya sp. HaHaR_3_96]|uniref:T9SS type B sorting domain-containing protein n=1 Tax=Olleya sp. HaHaR_3_96 TaxID=2745560 RepID=UPI001C4E957B|nr:T9SS type B sorting domain-containing protein [Olleya sp. HaHaR_3_96]QXP59403.1 T9SS type B sorting domain-containing protein [Olleya sp. HaHaR_3_96]
MIKKYSTIAFLFFIVISSSKGFNITESSNLDSDIKTNSFSDYAMSLNATGEECSGNGNIQIDINGSEIGATFEFLVYDISDLTTPINSETVLEGPITSTNFTTNITTLNSGTYLIRATEIIGSIETIIEQEITVPNNIIPIAFDAIQESACLGTIIVLLNSGNALEYRVKQAGVLIETITQTQIDAGAESIFTDLAFGNYTIEVEDICGNVVAQGINLLDLAPSYTTPITFENNIDDNDCSQTKLRIYILQNLSTGGVTSVLDENFFPFDVTITYDDDADGNDTVMTDVWTSTSQNNSYYNLPTQNTSYSVTTQVTDTCGTVVYLNTVDFSGPPTLDLTTQTTQDCGKQRLRFTDYENFAFPITMELITTPPAFDINNDPNLYNPIFPVGSNISDPITTPNTLYFGYYNLSVPNGSYTFLFTDRCGRQLNKSINVTTDNTPRELNIRSREGCADTGNLEINIKKQGTFDITSAAGFDSFTITSAPASYTGPLVVDISTSTVTTFFGDFLYLYDLPAGDYTFSVNTACGNVLTGSKTINGAIVQDVDTTITSFCGSFNLDLNATFNISNSTFVLQKFNTVDGVWANINSATAELTNYVDNTNFYLDGPPSVILNNNQNSYGQFITDSGFINNVTGSGLFRIYYSFYRTNEQEPCYDTLEEFTIGDNNITLVDFAVIDCGNGTNDLFIDALGVNLNYELISKDGVPLNPTINNGNNPVFTNIAPGLYVVQISDDCGAVSPFVINTNQSQPTVIQPYNLCVGDTGSLTINALSIIDVTWTKDGDPSFSATGNVINFDPYSATDTGTYNATLTYSTNPNSCINQTLSYTITNAPPNAGTGQTVDIAFIDTTLESLFNFITGPYDNFGTFTETTIVPSGTLDGTLWDATGLEAGTYTFDYTVDTGCNGIDSTTITITILESDLTAINDSVLDICPSTIYDDIINVLDNDTYGQLPLVQTDFLVTTEVVDPNNVITVDSIGNIDIADTSIAGQTYTLQYKVTEITNSDNFDIGEVTIAIKTITESICPTFPSSQTIVECYDDIPTNTTLSQSEFEALGNANGIINSNSCGSIEIRAENSQNNGNCNQIVTRTYTVREYSDSNNNNLHDVGEAIFYTTICTQEFLVNDTIAPVITGTIGNTTIDGCSATDVNTAAATVADLELIGLTITDACALDANLIVTNTDTATGNYPTIVTRVYTIADVCGNSSTATQTITIEDNQNPTIICPIPVTVEVDSTLCSATNVNLSTPPTGSDNCNIANITNDAPTVYALGETTVTWTATDNSGNIATCEQIVTVVDNENPTIVCPTAIMTLVDDGLCVANNVDLGIAPTGSDNCSIANIINDAPSSFPLGDTIVTWTITDGSGNTASCSQIVTVEDNQAPTIVCPVAITVDADSGLCTASNVNLGLPPTGSDNCSIASITNDAPLTFSLGDTIVTWTATDGSGNSVSCTQTVTVEDNEAPTFTAPTDIEIFSDINSNYDASIIVTGDVTDEMDNCSTNLESTFTDTTTNGPCQGAFVITRTWGLMDTHGNVANNQTQIITITNNTILANQNLDSYNLCDDNMETDGDPTNDSTTFDLTSQNTNVLNGLNATNYSVNYYESLIDAQLEQNSLSNQYDNINNPQTIYTRVDNTTPGSECYAIAELTLMVITLPIFELEDQYVLCRDTNATEIIETNLNPNNYSFEWSFNNQVLPAETGVSLEPTNTGSYSVIVTDNTTGCPSTPVSTTVVYSEAPVITTVTTLAFANQHNIIVTATSTTNMYEFSIDGVNWVMNYPNNNSYTFSNVTPGEYTITVRDTIGCGEDTITVMIIDYPLYFTPNGDGTHDTWNIYAISNQPDAIIYIFDRYGKLLKQLSPTDTGWDGTYNGNPMPTSDYWFTVEYREPSTNVKKIMKSHFTLKR